MEQIVNQEYEFGLFLSKKDTDAIHLFNSVPPSINDGLNGTFPEKIRRFNNAATFLVNSIKNVENLGIEDKPLYELCKDIPTDIDILYRQLIRNVYMELFIYQEKLLNIVCNLFFVKISKSRGNNISALKKRMIFFPNLKHFCNECDKLRKDKTFIKVMTVRDNEIHNMSQIDSFIYDLQNVENGVSIINKGYQIKALELRNNYIYTMHKLLEIRNIVQKILIEDNFWHIRKVLEENGEEIWIN
jgi:hypothetical protein